MLNVGMSTAVTDWAVLLVAKGSPSARPIPTRFVIDPITPGTVTTVTVAVAPPVTLPSAHSTRPPTRTQPPCEALKELKETDGGRKFVTVIAVAVAGPKLKTVMTLVR